MRWSLHPPHPCVEGEFPSNVPEGQPTSGAGQPHVWNHYPRHIKDTTNNGPASGGAENSVPKWAQLTLREANVQPTLGRTKTTTKNASS